MLGKPPTRNVRGCWPCQELWRGSWNGWQICHKDIHVYFSCKEHCALAHCVSGQCGSYELWEVYPLFFSGITLNSKSFPVAFWDCFWQKCKRIQALSRELAPLSQSCQDCNYYWSANGLNQSNGRDYLQSSELILQLWVHENSWINNYQRTFKLLQVSCVQGCFKLLLHLLVSSQVCWGWVLIRWVFLWSTKHWWHTSLLSHGGRGNVLGNRGLNKTDIMLVWWHTSHWQKQYPWEQASRCSFDMLSLGHSTIQVTIRCCFTMITYMNYL
jgi:hypothetical protein